MRACTFVCEPRTAFSCASVQRLVEWHPLLMFSVLVRAHLRSLTPLPKEELTALKRSVAELGALGRNLNQIARAVNQGERAPPPGRGDVVTMLRIAEALRDRFKKLLKANELSWTGHPAP
jgi:hypothetical protein